MESELNLIPELQTLPNEIKPSSENLVFNSIVSSPEKVFPNIWDVIIVGAGPAGLFAALEITRNKPLKVLIIERGNSLENRKHSETLCGIGGAGTYSDGKLHYTPVLSHEKLLDIFTIEEYERCIAYVDELFTFFGVTKEYTPKNQEEAQKLIDFCQKRGINLYSRKCKHVGTDHLPQIVKNIVDTLKKQGVEIICNTEVKKLNRQNGKLESVETENGKIFKAKKFIVAPGRVGAKWLQDEARSLGLEYDYQKVEIGIRVEFPASIMEEHSKIMHENIYTTQTRTFDDTIRTFCPCPNGRVATEDYGEYVSVNGHTDNKNPSENSNFNLTIPVQLTEPVENTTDYAISIAKMATTIGGGKPLLQRLKDLQSGRRSTWNRIRKSYVKPTLEEVTPGDISMGLPHRTVTNILEGLEKLDRVLPGLNSGATLLYAPEIKLRGNRIKINRQLQTQISNLFVAGDGAGTSGNIVGAAISGILAAQGVLKTETHLK